MFFFQQIYLNKKNIIVKLRGDNNQIALRLKAKHNAAIIHLLNLTTRLPEDIHVLISYGETSTTALTSDWQMDNMQSQFIVPKHIYIYRITFIIACA